VAVTWVKLDDRFAGNPKVSELSDAAFRLYVSALCWCSQHETDGVVTRKKAKMLGRQTRIVELVAAGLWHVTDHGYEVHDYLVYNPSRLELEQRREATRQRVTKHRGNGVTNADVTAAVTALPIPSRPDPVTELRPPVGPPGDHQPKVRPWRRVPEDWQPSQEHKQIALEMRVSFDLELAKFRDHEFAKARKDPDAAFRNWLRTANPTPANGQQRGFRNGPAELPERELTAEDRERNRRLIASVRRPA
jgi:hypothetical protein